MPGNVETIILKIIGDSTSGEKTLSKMQNRLAAFGASLTAIGATSLVTFNKLGQGGAQLEALEAKFARMAAAYGRSAEEMLASWEEAAAIQQRHQAANEQEPEQAEE